MIETGLLTNIFPHVPTAQQVNLFQQLDEFLKVRNNESVFILRGYAGTGKTTVVSALVKLLPSYKLKSVLLAPTGRAAKVISGYSGKEAFTIHKKIYRKRDAISPSSGFVRSPNPHTDTVFIVDEASMISNQSADGSDFYGQQLLSDLVEYIFNHKNCKLILVGDTAQLPPVGLSESPALDKEYMSSNFNVEVNEFELTEVLRQQQESGILENATRVRDLIRDEIQEIPQIVTRGYEDTFRMNGERLVDGLNYAYDKFGIEDTLVICRSNKNANVYNQQIRARILFREEEISTGDYLMVVKNNYSWLPEDSGQAFIANGDIAQIKRIKNISEQHGFRFADVTLEFPDYPNAPQITCKILLDTLTSESPNLPFAESKKLYEAVSEDYKHISNRRDRAQKIKEDPFYNALQVKFAYAVTCHKAQGGQWKAVFIDQGYLTEEMINMDFLRWMYTAVSRASEQLYFVNFGERFFE
ncbi:ATP-dependent DNA helicase [Solitalea koreensis]|uniref:Exodeoxyribonuclease-5 n=1 Tax=Solitalea koreensis TaxID=543615 RepID=A0A521D2A1_9SPHI|nr:AAA family ATPase [Solitalea koreensis]SMO65826.1 exodeoxyribonuclease-5 [Solitalea koreensis]